MKIIATHRFMLLLAVFTGAATASIIPVSSCTFNNEGGTGVNGGFFCNLYPSNPDGSLNDIATINYPTGYDPSIDPITPGFLVLVDPGLDPTDPTVMQNQNSWLQVVEFAPVVGPPYYSTAIQLFTLGCNNAANPNDTSCFPTYAAVTANASGYFFDVEPTSTPAYSTPYNYFLGDVKDHQYNVNFVAESAPEPASVATLSTGGFALILLGYWRRRASRAPASLDHAS